jgi:hypothetical protein
MQEQELTDNRHDTESINYIAWEPSSGNLNGYVYEVNKTANVVTHNFHTIRFNHTFADIPGLLADMQTTDGKDTAGIRWRNKTRSSVEVQIDEEQSEDSETDHTTEIVGFIALDFISD